MKWWCYTADLVRCLIMIFIGLVSGSRRGTRSSEMRDLVEIVAVCWVTAGVCSKKKEGKNRFGQEHYQLHSQPLVFGELDEFGVEVDTLRTIVVHTITMLRADS